MISILNKLKEAYSKENYTDSGWEDCVKVLKDKKLSDEQVVGFMLSKHMRWACDNVSTEYGQNDSTTLIKYLNKYPRYLEQKELNSLI